MQRGSHQGQAGGDVMGSVGASSNGHHKKANGRGVSWLRLTSVLLLFSITILLVALVISFVTTKPKSEFTYVDNSKYQAVFINGGQVYFGHIQTLNNKYMRLTGIFYLRVNQTVQPNGSTTQSGNPELVPLGCELHRPQSEMLINRDQVTFWENLKDDSSLNTVPGAIKKYIADNPNGKACTDSTSSSSSSSNSTATKP